MEKSHDKLLDSLLSFRVSIPDKVASIKDIEPEGLVSICAQCLNLISRDSSSFPSSLPASVADKLRICREMASAVKSLGFIGGDMSFHKFLYPSEEDAHELVRFLVGRLAESSVAPKASDVEDADSEERKEWWKVEDMLRELRLKTEPPTSSCAIYKDLDDLIVGTMNSQKSIKEFGMLKINAPAIMDSSTGANDQVLEVNGTAQGNQSTETSHIRCVVQELRNKEQKLMDEVKAESGEIIYLEDKLELLKAAAAMASDTNRPANFFLDDLNGKINARKRNLLEVQLHWNSLRTTLEEQKGSLEKSLYTARPEFEVKFQKLKLVEQEADSISSETQRREEEYSELCEELKQKPKQESRTSYVQRIKEITKNSRKQHADVERILKETRELQLESNSIQERLHRTYAVLDETVFREAKKDQLGRQAYRLLTSIHESFEQISEKILSTDRVQREIAEHEKKLASVSSRSSNMEGVQADLEAIIKENEQLERYLEND